MTDAKIIKRIDVMCVKNGCIRVENIKKNGEYTLIVPVFNGEYNEDEIAALEMESSFDGEWPILYNFPENLLSDEDYNYICECLIDELYSEFGYE